LDIHSIVWGPRFGSGGSGRAGFALLQARPSFCGSIGMMIRGEYAEMRRCEETLEHAPGVPSTWGCMGGSVLTVR
jgi:hypothetical protein